MYTNSDQFINKHGVLLLQIADSQLDIITTDVIPIAQTKLIIYWWSKIRVNVFYLPEPLDLQTLQFMIYASDIIKLMLSFDTLFKERINSLTEQQLTEYWMYSASLVIQISIIPHLNYPNAKSDCSIRVNDCPIRVFGQSPVYKSMSFSYPNKFIYPNTFAKL